MTTSFIFRLHRFFSITIWKDSQNKYKQLWFKILRVVYLSGHGFKTHHGPLRASALTFYSLLSLVPVMAMAFGVAQGFGFERLLEKELLNYFSGQQEVIGQVINFARKMLENTKGGLIAGVGVMVLFWSVIKVIGNIEASFNHIWNATPRPWSRKLTDYLAITIIAPLFLIISSSVTVYAAAQVLALSSQIGLEKLASPIMNTGLTLVPYVILWFLFILLYLIMPNTKVRFSSALPAAILSGSAYQIMQMAYVKFQMIMTSYNAIYGSFAALPLFLIWLNLSWHVVLFGAEVSYATQNVARIDPTQDGQGISSGQIKLLALGLAAQAAHVFQQGLAPRTPSQLGHSFQLSPRLSQFLVDLLVQGQILLRLDGKIGEEHPVHPAQDITTINIAQVIQALDKIGYNPNLVLENPELKAFEIILQSLDHSLESDPVNQLLIEVRPRVLPPELKADYSKETTVFTS